MMSTVIKVGWLNDESGNKFAPKTLGSQVITSDGTTVENKIIGLEVALSANLTEVASLVGGDA